MARANLGALLGNVDDKPVPAPSADARDVALEPAPPLPTAVSVAPTPKRPRVVAGAETAPYLRLVRKETRLREDQLNQLTLHARRLNRAKGAGGARITDNTLIRVAVDLLLARIRDAAGTDEASLLESLN